MIIKYYNCILNFTTATGFASRNDDSRAVLIFTIVLMLNVGTVFGLLGLKVQSINKFVLIGALLLVYFFVYKYFTDKENKEEILESYNKLVFEKKVIYNVAFFSFYNCFNYYFY